MACLDLLSDEQLCFRLSSRKNVPEGSLLKRKCWCDTAQSLLCPVHVIWNYIAKFEVGMQVFAGISPGRAIGTLRHYLGLLEVPQAKLYRCHDIRRGHADDMRASGSIQLISDPRSWPMEAWRCCISELLELRSLRNRCCFTGGLR